MKRIRFDSNLYCSIAMAGNIIPAIATTNAVIAGFVIMKAFGVLNGNIKNNPRVSSKNMRRLCTILTCLILNIDIPHNWISSSARSECRS
jgi:hypothetical protein